MSVELLNDLRRMILAGEDVSDDELARAVETLRSSRNGAVVAKAEAKAKKAAPIDIAALFSSLGK